MGRGQASGGNAELSDQMKPNYAFERSARQLRCRVPSSLRSSAPAAVARGSGRDARPEPAAAPDSCCTTYGCSAPAGEPRGR